jgi:hypothetical protein
VWIGLPVGIAIALVVVEEYAFGEVMKFGCGAIAFFRFSHKAIAFSSYSAQVKAFATPSYFEEFEIGFPNVNPTYLTGSKLRIHIKISLQSAPAIC